MAFGDFATLVTDFNGPDQNPLTDGGNWAQISGTDPLQRLGNQATSSFGGPPNTGFGGGYYTATIFGPDVETYITLNTLGPGGTSLLGARLGNPTLGGPHYRVIWQPFSGNTWFLQRVDSLSSVTTLATTSHAVAAGNKIGLQIIGRTLTGYLFAGGVWTSILSVVDTSVVNTGAGFLLLGFDNSTWRADDLFAGTIPSSFTPRSYRRLPVPRH